MDLVPIMIAKIAVMELVQDVVVVVRDVPLVVQVDVQVDVVVVAQDALQDAQDVQALVKHYVTRVALIVWQQVWRV